MYGVPDSLCVDHSVKQDTMKSDGSGFGVFGPSKVGGPVGSRHEVFGSFKETRAEAGGIFTRSKGNENREESRIFERS